MTHETQNALLKLFEEPPQTSRFALVVPGEDSVIATLRSRFQVISLRGEEDSYKSGRVLVREFLKKSYAERLEEIARQVKKKEEGWATQLLVSLEEFFYVEKDLHALACIAFVRTYSDRRGASLKMLLEHLALSLPSIPLSLP